MRLVTLPLASAGQELEHHLDEASRRIRLAFELNALASPAEIPGRASCVTGPMTSS